MWFVGKGCAVMLGGFALVGLGAFAYPVFGSYAMAVVAVGLAIVFYGHSRASAETVREITIPFAESELPKAEVVAALERMGCVISASSFDSVTGITSGLGSGQVVTVTLGGGGLHVRSSFPDTRAVGARKNQENVEQFKVEWERRAEAAAAERDPAARAAAEGKAREFARNTIWGGALSVALGVGALGLALFVPSRKGASPGGKYYLAGMGIMLLGIGVPRLAAAVRRLREPPPR